MRVSRVRSERVPSLGGSTASGSIADIARNPPTALVSKLFVGTDISVLTPLSRSVLYFTYTLSVIEMTIV